MNWISSHAILALLLSSCCSFESTLALAAGAGTTEESTTTKSTTTTTRGRRNTQQEEEPYFPEGLLPPKKQTRMIGGTSVTNPSSRAPFYGKAGYDDDLNTSEILCGATLIGRDIAISAAHCQVSLFVFCMTPTGHYNKHKSPQ